VKRESEKCQNKHSVAIAGIDLCHIYLFVIHTQQDATHRNKFAKYIYNNQVEEDEMGGSCRTNGREEERLWVIGGKAREKETTRKTRRRSAYNIRLYLGEMGWSDVDWIGLSQDRSK
jgi:hypothetical protein